MSRNCLIDMKNAVKELYEKARWLVCDYTEIDERDVITSNREVCVDARYILVGVLSEYLTDEEIAKQSGLTRACCNKIRNGMRAKMTRYSFRCMFQSIKGKVKDKVDNPF